MDHEQTYFLFKEVGSDNWQLTWACVKGDSSELCQATRVPTERAWLFLARQFWCVPSLMEAKWLALGKPVSEISIPSFLTPHLLPAVSCMEPLPASEAFLYPPLWHKVSGGSAFGSVRRSHIHQPGYNLEIFLHYYFKCSTVGASPWDFRILWDKLGVRGDGARAAFTTSTPTLTLSPTTRVSTVSKSNFFAIILKKKVM